MSINDFITNKNIELIWEVINDYDLLIKNQDMTNNTILFIQKNIYNFYESEKVSINNLKEMNKKFILYIINYINNYFSSINNLSNTSTYKKSFHPKENTENNYTDNYSSNNKELVTLEQIQNDRKNLFEKQLLEKQKDFSDTIKLNIPSTPNFSDKIDEPLSEINQLINTLKQQRNLEEETFKNTSLNESNLNENNNWLKSKETSIKKEKNSHTSNSNTYNKYDSNTSIKYIKIEKDDINNINIESKDIIDLNSSNVNINDIHSISFKKHITWQDDNINNQVNTIENNEKNNIFLKLKKVDKNNSLELDIPFEVNSIKNEIKIIYTKIEELDKTMNNILTFLKNK